MAQRRKEQNGKVRKIQYTSRMYFVNIPMEFIRDLQWREKQRVVIKRKGNSLIIKDWKE